MDNIAVTKLPIVKNLQHRNDRLYHSLILAQARVYDLLYKDKPEPTEVELKSRVIYLENELKTVIGQRELLKEQLKVVGKKEGE
jgi:hypothetical protein